MSELAEPITPPNPTKADRLTLQTYVAHFNRATAVLESIGKTLAHFNIAILRAFLEEEVAPQYPGNPLDPGGALYAHKVVLDTVEQLSATCVQAGRTYREALEGPQQTAEQPGQAGG